MKKPKRWGDKCSESVPLQECSVSRKLCSSACVGRAWAVGVGRLKKAVDFRGWTATKISEEKSRVCSGCGIRSAGGFGNSGFSDD